MADRATRALCGLVLFGLGSLVHVTPVRADAPAPAPAAVAAVSPQQLARQCFEAGLSLARAGRYTAAKAMFLEAYAAQPHPFVFYNIAQAELQLGELASAAEYLRRFLDEGGAAVSIEQRQVVEAELAHIDAERAKQLSAPAAEARPALTAPPRPDVAPGVTRTPSDSSPPSHAGSERVSTRADVSTSTTPVWSYFITGFGSALLAGAAGLYLWNDHRYEQWQTEDSVLRALDDQLSHGEPVPDDPATLSRRVAAHNSRLDAIERIDLVTLVAASVGAVGIGTGVYALISNAASPAKERRPGAARVSIGATAIAVGARWEF